MCWYNFIKHRQKSFDFLQNQFINNHCIKYSISLKNLSWFSILVLVHLSVLTKIARVQYLGGGTNGWQQVLPREWTLLNSGACGTRRKETLPFLFSMIGPFEIFENIVINKCSLYRFYLFAIKAGWPFKLLWHVL